MKRLFILSLAALGFVACEKRGEHVILKGKISNYNGAPVQIIGGTDAPKELKVNADGTFADTLGVKPNYYFLFNNSGLYVPLYIQQGDDLSVNIDLAQQPASVKFAGKDTIASSYLMKKSSLTKELEQNNRELFGKDIEEFKQGIEDIKKKRAELLSNTKNLPKEFIALEEKANNYYLLFLKSSYPQAHSHFANKEVEMPKEFADELASVNYDNADDFDAFYEYKQLVFRDFYTKSEGSAEPDWNPLITYVRGLKSENIKSTLAQFFVEGLSAGNEPELNELLLSSVKEFVKDEKLVKKAEARNASFENLKAGKPSPAFDFENFAGGKTSLESLKGKLVYIDVWATWCVPCLQEIPALQALEKEYHGKNIAFVSISIDQNKQKWVDYQTANKPTGIQLYGDLSVEDNFADAYGIQSIPRFILIDKEGNIISASAPRPSDPRIKELINKNL